jgi:type I restriction enzyme M protein
MNAPATFFDKILTFAGDEIRPEYQPRSIGLIPPSVGKLCFNGGRGQEAVFVTGIYAPLQKLFTLKGEVLDPIFSIINLTNGRELLDASRRSKAKKRNTRAISPA